mgnify:CR=1 FL=1
MQLRYIDTHSHLHFKQYDEDREKVLENMQELGVGTIAIGTDLETSKQAIELAEKYPDVVLGATVGIHPNDSIEEFDKGGFDELVSSSKVVGVGECGLDYFRLEKKDGVCNVCEIARQEKLFIQQIEFALEHSLPLMLHIRPNKDSDDAHEDALRILEAELRACPTKLQRSRGTCHFFTSSAEVALRYVELGFYISFPGVITFAPETHEAVRAVPLDRILSETDSPYAAPVPKRGQRNEPVYVEHVVRAIAEIRGEDLEMVLEQLLQNAKDLFSV